MVRPDLVAGKYPTGELIRRQKAGIPLEDGEPEPLIRREKGSWKGVEGFVCLIDNEDKWVSSASIINTVKTTLPHRNCSEATRVFYEVRVLRERKIKDFDWDKFKREPLSSGCGLFDGAHIVEG